MPTTSNLRSVSRDRRPCFYLKIDGIPVLFGSVTPPDDTYDLNGVSTPYAKRVCIVPGQGFKFSRKLNVKKNTVECAPVEIVLASTERANEADSLDPARIFGRLGFPGSDASLEFAAGQEIRQTTTAPFTLTMADDPTSKFSVGDVVHVGREAFRVSAMDASANTITINQRGVLGTRIAHHLYDSQTQVALIMTRPACFFRNRRAIIYEGSVGDDDVGRDWVERWRGFVTNEPEVSTSGKVPTVTVTVSPLTALLDLPLGGTEPPAHLSRTAHSFKGTQRYWSFLEKIPQGCILNVSTNITSDNFDGGIEDNPDDWFGSGYIPMTDVGVFRHNQFASIFNKRGHPFTVPLSILGGLGAGVYYPRAAGLQGVVPPDKVGLTRSFDYIKAAVPIYNDTGTYPVDFGAGKPLLDGRVVNSRVSHYRDAYLGSDENVLWPDVLRKAINADGFVMSDGLGMGGTMPGGAKSSLGRGGGYTALHLNVESKTLSIKSSLLPPGDPIEHVFRHLAPVEINLAPHLETSWRFAADGNLKPFLPLPASARLTPLAFSIEDQDEENEVVVEIPPQDSVNPNTVIVDVKLATAFYQSGETFLLLDSPINIPASGSLHLAVRRSNDVLGVFEAESVSEVTLADGATVYEVALKSDINQADESGNRMKSFAEYPGEDRIEITSSVVFEAQASIGEVLLQLLCSSGGNNIQSQRFDKLPFGAGLADGTSSEGSADDLGLEIDVASFLAIESPLPNSQFRPSWVAGQSIRDAIGGLLQAAGHVVDIVTNGDGKCLLTAIPLGFPNRSSVVASLTETDIADKPNPKSKTEFAQANVFEFKYAYDVEGQSKASQRVKDAVSIDITGEERAMSIALPGVTLSETIDRVSQLRPIFSRLRYELALPRRIFELHLRAGLALQSRIGGTYSLTHSLLRDVNKLGLNGALCRMRSIAHDGWRASARAEFVFYGNAGAGWAPSCSVVGVLSATQVSVSKSAHSSLRAPGSGSTIVDASGFEALTVGDKCLIIARGDMDNTTEVEISAIADGGSTTSITFTGAHGVTASGSNVVAFLVPMRSSRGTVPAEHSKYAQIGAVTVS